ncbi:unnamed protein product [Nyctereutes procyonoides]|uniref:(raccoon dog) hypothetical protein n=1 Tax=Nyctereutes procyonoides TaxID=34880 RepID=A0A811ZSB2_NYCPR|nr:unnamed protein product [Nyctereutes procyonoides]
MANGMLPPTRHLQKVLRSLLGNITPARPTTCFPSPPTTTTTRSPARGLQGARPARSSLPSRVGLRGSCHALGLCCGIWLGCCTSFCKCACRDPGGGQSRSWPPRAAPLHGRAGLPATPASSRRQGCSKEARVRALGTAFPSLAGLLWGHRLAPFLPDANASAPFPPNTSAPFLPDASSFPTRCKCSFPTRCKCSFPTRCKCSFPTRYKCSFPTRYKYHKRIGVIEVMIDIDHEITPREADHPTVSSIGIVTKFSKPKFRTHGLPRTQEQRDKPHEGNFWMIFLISKLMLTSG